MNENQLIQQGARGCLTSLIITFLAICAMIISINRQYPAHPACGGMLGAGFPAIFICDDWGGGSPSSSWGKITFVDVPNGGIRSGGFLCAFLTFLSSSLYLGDSYYRVIPTPIIPTLTSIETMASGEAPVVTPTP